MAPDFARNRKWFYLLSACILIPGIISLLLPGGLRLGIDFTGGTIITMQFDQPVDQGALRDAFGALGHDEAIVQATSGDNAYVVRTSTLQQPQTDASGNTAPSEQQQIQDSLTQQFGNVQFLTVDQVSPLVAESIVRYAILAVAAASVGILLYLWWAFKKVSHPVRYGASAVAALLHDAVLVIGVFSILGRIFPIDIESTFIVAVLTIIGFSVHDTIVVFDRIRENFVRHAGEPFEDVVNHSLMQTLTRSLNTSLTVILTLIVLMLFGGVTIRTFVLALLIGITTGTYSSIFIASMLLVSWQLGELDWLWPWPRLFRRLRPQTATA